MLTGIALLTLMPRHDSTAIAYPWAFDKGTQTSRITVQKTLSEIEQRAGFAAKASSGAETEWTRLGLGLPEYGHRPSTAALKKFGEKEGVDVVVFGDVSWHTRSIWVGAGPKTISTATVHAHVFDVHRGRVVFSKSKEGRSDERESDLKLVADVLLTPVVSAVSGGPATPREQRAAQIALGRALHDWVKSRQ
jgi:hypothetical protein